MEFRTYLRKGMSTFHIWTYSVLLPAQFLGSSKTYKLKYTLRSSSTKKFYQNTDENGRPIIQ